MNKTIMRILKIIGNALVILSIIYIIYILLHFDIDWNVLGSPMNVAIKLTFISGFVIINNFINAYAWKRSIDFFSAKNNNTKKIVSVYLRSNLQKYLPGNVIQYVGRNVLGNQLGIPHKFIVAASVTEMVLIALSALIFACFGAWNSLKKVLDFLIEQGGLLVLLPMLLVLLILIAGAFFVKKYLPLIRNRNGEIIELVFVDCLLYVLNFILAGVLLSTILMWLFDESVAFFYIAAANTLSWLSGYIVPGSPGGLGIREAVLILLLKPLYAAEIITLAAVLVRICSVLGDFFSALIVVGMDKIDEKKNKF